MEKVVVAGLGYVGLPLACIFAESGFQTVGIDIDNQRVQKINKGISPIKGEEPGLAELLSKVIANGSLVASTNPDEYANADAIFICVDTPIGSDHKPRLQVLEAVLKEIGRRMKKDTLVSVESTLPPLTMQN